MPVIVLVNVAFAAFFLYKLITEDYTERHQAWWYLDGFAFLLNAMAILNHVYEAL